MIKTASLTILDSGYLKPDNSGTQLSAANRANSGTAFTLRSVSFKPIAKANLDNTPVLSSSDVADVNFGTIENLGFTISGVLKMDVSADQALVYPLVRCIQTKGYKFLYYNSTGSDKDKQLVVQLANSHVFTAGEITAFSVAAYEHIHVF